MLPAAIGLVVGISICTISQWIAWSIVALSSLAFIILYLKQEHFWAFLSIMLALGALTGMSRQEPTLPLWMESAYGTFEGTVEESNETSNGNVKCIIRIQKCQNLKINGQSLANSQKVPQFKCIIYVKDYVGEIPNGSLVRFNGNLSNLNSQCDVPYSFDYAEFLKRQGISAQANSYDASFSIISPPGSIQKFINNARASMYNGIVESRINGPTAAFLIAAILGDNKYVDPSTLSEFRTTGIAHILALSGLHVGILATLASFLLFPIRPLLGSIYIRSLLTLAIIWAYALITGMSPSVMRASVMISAYLIAQMLQRSSSPFNSLCLAATIVLLASPMSLFTVGFQLSFCSVAAILIFIHLMPKRLYRRPILYYTVLWVGVPVAAMAGSGIISVLYFGIFPPMFLVANVVTGFIFPWLLGAGFILMALSIMGIAGNWLASIADFLYSLLHAVIEWIASTPVGEGINLEIAPVSAAFYGLFILGISLALILRNWNTAKGRPSWLIASISTAFLLFALTLNSWGKPTAPMAELIIPRDSYNSIILREENYACILPLDIYDASNSSHPYVSTYAKFFAFRGCESVRINPNTWSTPNCAVFKDGFTFGNRSFRIFQSDSLIGNASERVNYAIVADGFNGKIGQILRVCNADTIAIAASVKAARRKRLIRECGDSIPCVDMRRHLLKFEINSF